MTAPRTRGTVRLARGVYLVWGWSPGHDDETYRPRVGWQVECRETILLYGHRRCPLARAEEVALHQASSRLIALHKLLQDAGWEATTRSAALLADRIYPEGSAERRAER